MGKNKTKKRTRRPNKGWLAGSSATQTICISFLLVIAVGTLLLTLPISSRTGRLGVIDAMFTATSATCVTGLVVRDTWSQFSLFGQVIILMLIQVGGLGLVTLTSFFALAARRRMGFRDLRLLGESVSADGLSKATEVLKIVIKLAAAFEAVGIVLLLFAFVPQFGAEGVWVSVFTAISAFCNAGFDLFGRFGAYSSLVPYVNNYYVQAVIMFMIMAGGLGFMVWVELAEYRKKRRLSLHAKVVLQFSAIFWVGGAVLLALLEWSNPRTMGGLSVPGKIMAALFQSVSTRTAGMNTIDGGSYDGQPLEQVVESVGKEALCGTNAARFPYFPVLIKLIDAKDNLSIQVHPDNDYARRVENEFGKTEMWYVLDAAPGAQLIYGFKEKISKEAFKAAIENNTLPQVLNHVDIHKGDVFFIEAGTVHAIGKGALIAEIQQNSNVTYRVYDYDRRGADGKPRELHVAKALDVAVPEPPKYDTQPMGQKENIDGGSRQLLARCPLFTVYHYAVSDTVQLTAGAESFQHILVTDGNGAIDGRLLQKGDSFLVPAGYGNFAVSGQLEMLVTSI